MGHTLRRLASDPLEAALETVLAGSTGWHAHGPLNPQVAFARLALERSIREKPERVRANVDGAAALLGLMELQLPRL